MIFQDFERFLKGPSGPIKMRFLSDFKIFKSNCMSIKFHFRSHANRPFFNQLSNITSENGHFLNI